MCLVALDSEKYSEAILYDAGRYEVRNMIMSIRGAVAPVDVGRPPGGALRRREVKRPDARALHDDPRGGVPWEDIAVLLRSTGHLDVNTGRCSVVAQQEGQAHYALVTDRSDFGRLALELYRLA